MSSSITPSQPAVRLRNVSKIYKLFGSQRDQIVDVLGLRRLGFKAKNPIKEFAALSDVSLDVPRGHRIGIVGRNGAGKTTLLKLICGNFAPSKGEVEVNGAVQALMNVGLGFHPEYTGRENIEASLQYSGLGRDEYQRALTGIIEFCELGDFLDQPFKTYSLGMQARLMFAAATAIRPDILIVDEVLGAGDAYFVAKSKMRVEKLVNSGCTMLLVSHSMQQILELCDEAIWLDKGRIRMQGDAFLVVKAYEEYLHGPNCQVVLPDKIDVGLAGNNVNAAKEGGRQTDLTDCRKAPSSGRKLQEPFFLPNSAEAFLPEIAPPQGFNFVAQGGVSRWESIAGVKLCGFSIVTENGEGNVLLSLRPAKIVLNLIAEIDASFKCRYGIVFNDHLGNCVIRIYSPIDEFSISRGGMRQIEMMLNPVQLGPGEYTIGISVLQGGSLEMVNNAKRYDLLGRSFEVKVETQDTIMVASANFFHSAEWAFGK